MPQMAPLSWTLLFLMFIMVYMFVATKMYFSIQTNLNNELKVNNNKNNPISWKW